MSIPITHTTQIFDHIVKSYGQEPYSHTWAEMYGTKFAADLNTLKGPMTTPRGILIAKRAKLYERIYKAIEVSKGMFYDDLCNLKVPVSITFDITPETYHKLAKQICNYIHPITLEFPEPEHLEWDAVKKHSIIKVTEFEFNDLRFINAEHTDEVEMVSEEIYGQVFQATFPDDYFQFLRYVETPIKWSL